MMTTMTTNDKVLEALERVQRAVNDNVAGGAGVHIKLLNGIHLLRAVATQKAFIGALGPRSF